MIPLYIWVEQTYSQSHKLSGVSVPDQGPVWGPFCKTINGQR
jgi:hypothetical protein